MLTSLLLLVGGGERHLARDIILIVICVLVCAYLFVALLWPEKF
jgi:K+-transporting ATPase KdpF subunit